MPSSRSSARNKALFGPVQSPCHGETMAFLSCLRRNASVKSIIQSTLTGPGAFCQRKWEFNQEKLPLCQQDYGSKRRDKGCMYCLLCGSREGLKSDRGLGSGLLKTYSWFCHWEVAKLWDFMKVTSEFCLSFAICKMGVNLPTSLHVVRLNSLVLAAWELQVPEKEGAKCKAQQSWREYSVWISSGYHHGAELHSVISI